MNAIGHTISLTSQTKHRLKGNISKVFVSIPHHLWSKETLSFQSQDCHIPFHRGVLTQVSSLRTWNEWQYGQFV